MKKILWIDDDRRLLDDSTPLFERNGLHVFKAGTVTEALSVLRDSASSIEGMIIDVKLAGGEDGLDLLDDLHHRFPDIPKVVFTAYPEYEDHLRAERDGAAVYFEKIDKSIPLDPAKQAKFFQTLHRALSPRGTFEACEGSGRAGNLAQGAGNPQYVAHLWERVVASAAAVVVLAVALFLVVRNEPFRDPNLVVLTRIVLSTCVGALGAAIPGFLHIGVNARGLAIRAGGALALFVLSYLFTPSVLSTRTTEAEDKANRTVEETTDSARDALPAGPPR